MTHLVGNPGVVEGERESEVQASGRRVEHHCQPSVSDERVNMQNAVITWNRNRKISEVSFHSTLSLCMSGLRT